MKKAFKVRETKKKERREIEEEMFNHNTTKIISLDSFR